MPGTKKPAAGGIREVPRELLDRGREMAGAGREVWLAGLGVFALAGEEGSELFARLVKAGEALEKRGRARLEGRRGELVAALEERIEPVRNALRKAAPSRGDVHDLARKVDHLTHRVETLVAKVSRGSEPPEDRTVKVYRVFAEPNGWAVGLDGVDRAVEVLPTKEEALEHARTIARADFPSRLEVYRKDGALQDTFEF